MFVLYSLSIFLHFKDSFIGASIDKLSSQPAFLSTHDLNKRKQITGSELHFRRIILSDAHGLKNVGIRASLSHFSSCAAFTLKKTTPPRVPLLRSQPELFHVCHLINKTNRRSVKLRFHLRPACSRLLFPGVVP